jgi:cation diffusion facilitator family transporter
MNGVLRVNAARRVALVSIALSGALSVLKVGVGWMAGSRAVLADGFEAAGDVVASGVVLFGLAIGGRPPDENHPYGHGRLELLSGFMVGVMLAVAGVLIGGASVWDIDRVAAPPAAYAVWPLLVSIAVKLALTIWKFRKAGETGSSGLRADAWNDSVDILSGLVALLAVGLTLSDPVRFRVADRVGGLGVGLIVIFLGLRVVRDSTMQLIDTMPDDGLLAEVRRVAEAVPGAERVEKCFARKTGLQFHVDLHLEVDPQLTVRASHDIAREVRKQLKEQLDWVADVMVHVEPSDPAQE